MISLFILNFHEVSKLYDRSQISFSCQSRHLLRKILYVVWEAFIIQSYQTAALITIKLHIASL